MPTTTDEGQGAGNELGDNELQPKKEVENGLKRGDEKDEEIGMSGKMDGEKFRELFTRFHPFLAAYYFFGD